MNMNNRPIPDKSRIGIVRTVSTYDVQQGKYPVDELIQRQIWQQLADELVHTRIKKTVGNHSTEYRLDLVVLDIDDFYGVVHKCAQAMYGRPLFSIDEQEPK